MEKQNLQNKIIYLLILLCLTCIKLKVIFHRLRHCYKYSYKCSNDTKFVKELVFLSAEVRLAEPEYCALN